MKRTWQPFPETCIYCGQQEWQHDQSSGECQFTDAQVCGECALNGTRIYLDDCEHEDHRLSLATLELANRIGNRARN